MTEDNQLPCEKITKQTTGLIEMTKAKQVDHSIPIWLYLTTIVLFVIAIITALLLQYYYTATDQNLQHHFTQLLEKINSEEIFTEKDYKIDHKM